MATKLLFIVCEEGFEPDVMDAMTRLGVSHFTRWADCRGAGETGQREGTAIWPGLNVVLMVLLEEALVEPLWADLKQARDSFPVTPGVKIMATEAVMLS